MRFDGRELPFAAPPKTLPLLAYLIVHSGRPVLRRQAAMALWPDCEEETARSNLRRHLHWLRRALPARAREDQPWIVCGPAKLEWNLDAPASIDVFESDPPYGEFLEGYYDDWVLLERERLRDRHIERRLQIAFEAECASDFSSATHALNGVLELNPLHEAALRRLMTVRYAAGDKAGATFEYARFAERLRADVGVEPMPETIALYERIRRDRLLPRAGEIPNAAPARPESPLPFVGRSAVLEDLLEGWHRAAFGKGNVALIFGEAGVGKSRLVRECTLRAEKEGARVLSGSSPAIETVPYQALREALLDALPMLLRAPIEPKWLSALSVILPEIGAEVPGIARPEALDAQHEQARLFEAAVNAVAAIASQRPTVLVLEDQHWSGEASLALLNLLILRAAEMPLLLIATFRDDDLDRVHPLRAVRRSAVSASHVRQHALRALNNADVEAILRAVLGDSTPDMLERFVAQSDGNPFFLGEALHDFVETHGASETSVPPGLEAVVDARLARLSSRAHALAQVASVIGRSFNVELVREVCKWPQDEILDGLDELLDRHVIRETSKAGGTDYAFVHHVLQAAAYASIEPEALHRRHRRTARVLSDLSAGAKGNAAEIARHWDRGGAPERAAEHYVRAALYAQSVFANAEALRYASRAAQLARDPAILFEAVGLCEEAHQFIGDREAQRNDLARLEQLARQMGDPGLACEVSRRRCKVHHELSDFDAEALEAKVMRRWAQASGLERYLAAADLIDAFVSFDFARYEQAANQARRAIERYEYAGFVSGAFMARSLLAEIHLVRGDGARAAACLEEARPSMPLDDSTMLDRWLRLSERVACLRGDVDAAAGYVRERTDLAVRCGDVLGAVEGEKRLAELDASWTPAE